MIYQIYDAGASILIEGDRGIHLLKHHVTGISIIGNNLVRIGSVNPLRHILLDYRSIMNPEFSSAMMMANYLNALVTSCVCGGQGGGGG